MFIVHLRNVVHSTYFPRDDGRCCVRVIIPACGLFALFTCVGFLISREIRGPPRVSVGYQLWPEVLLFYPFGVTRGIIFVSSEFTMHSSKP